MDMNDFLNNNKKTTIAFGSTNFINELQSVAIKKLKELSTEFTSGELNAFLINFNKNMKALLIAFDKMPNNNKVKGLSKISIDVVKLEIKVCVDLIDDFLKLSKTNKRLTFSKFLLEKEKKLSLINQSTQNNNQSQQNKRRRTTSKDFTKIDDQDTFVDDEPDDPNDSDYIDEDDGFDEDFLDDFDYNEDDIDEDDIDEDDIDYDEDDIDDDDDVNIQQINRRNMNKHVNNNQQSKDFMNELIKSSTVDTNSALFTYFSSLSKKDKVKNLKVLKEINSFYAHDRPLLFKIIMLDVPISQKNYILKKYLTLVASRGESTKLKAWIDAVMTIPFGIYKGTDYKKYNTTQIKSFLDTIQKTMDKAVWGHDDAKRYIIQLMGQMLRNPDSNGNIIGLWGPPGTGKTSLIKEGIAKTMDRPFVFISLGGATDSSFLEGHSYTYEGSIYGKIANALITTKCMNPIIYFDELDKLSSSHKGDEINNLLIHLTDPVQNSHFRDKYFHGIDLDLSKATIIFSFNNPALIDKILLDRITTIETKYLLLDQKIYIGKNYLLPEILKDVGLTNESVIIDSKIIRFIVEKYTNEGGVRKLKSLLYNIVRELNIANLTKTKLNNKNIIFPYHITEENVKTIFKNKYEFEYDKINKEPKVGIVNGLYATTSGIGGVLPIETLWIPTNNSLEIKATGCLEKVIKESTQVACSLAWNLLSTETQNDLLKQWKDNPRGFHLHCPDGSTPKDGPSAGAALTLALYSMFTNKKIRNDMALTGEINLQGNVTAIGGLEEKMEGAKRAGVTLVLYPKENQKDVDKIKERNTELFQNGFTIKAVETIHDVINCALI